ncbi:MAG: alkaline phosphatase family protein, partial [Gammaproteobacteria bacterium]|nr:alkaline phosphatase family protein [Gammaproteobacteria bacterium]
MSSSQKPVVVLMVVDGLRGDMVTPEFVPTISEVAADSRHFRQHHSVFPSATRVNSASIATGCYPAQHRLAGNA